MEIRERQLGFVWVTILMGLCLSEGGAEAVFSTIFAIFLLTMMVVLGRSLAFRLLRHFEMGTTAALLVGMGVSGALGVVSCMLGFGLLPVLVLVIAIGLAEFPLIFMGGSLRLDSLSWVFIAILSLLCFWDAVQFPIGTDELYYHLPLAKNLWQTGEIIGGELRPNGSRPMLLHACYGLFWGGGGHVGVTVAQVVLGIGLSAQVAHFAEERVRGAGFVALLLLFGSYTWILGIGQIGSDIPAAAALFVAAFTPSVMVCLLLLGFALSWKYTSIGLVLAVIVLRVRTRRHILQMGLWIAGLLSLGVLPNILKGYHPLFPYLGWRVDMPFQILDRYGMGREFVDFLWLPLRMVVNAQPDGFQFLGQLNYLWLFMIPALVGVRYFPRLGGLTVFGLISWAAGPQLLRHFLLVMPFAAAFIGVVVARKWWLRTIGVVVALLSLPITGRILLSDAGPYRLDGRQGVCQEALRMVNQAVPTDSKVGLFYCWSGYLLERSYVLGSVEDHIPSRQWILQHQLDALRNLRDDASVDFVVVGPSPFGKKPYEGVDSETWERLYVKPAEILEQALIRDGILIFQAGGARVYQIREN